MALVSAGNVTVTGSCSGQHPLGWSRGNHMITGRATGRTAALAKTVLRNELGICKRSWYPTHNHTIRV